MKVNINILGASGRRNCYKLCCKGWFGDMDEKFSWEEEYSADNPKDTLRLNNDIIMLERICGSPYIETEKKILEYLAELSITRRDVTRIPTDSISYEMLPSIDEITVSYHDNGQEFACSYEIKD